MTIILNFFLSYMTIIMEWGGVEYNERQKIKVSCKMNNETLINPNETNFDPKT